MSRSRFGSTRSRYRQIGADVFVTQTPPCPPGQHYVADEATAIRGVSLGACAPDVVTLKPLTFDPAAPAAPVVVVQPLPPAAAPTGGDAATAPAPATPATVCPDLWPWWWLIVAFGVGAAGGYYLEKNQKKAKRNAGRVANAAAGRIVNGISDAAIARLVG